MNENFPVRIFVDKIIDDFVERLEKFAVSFGRDEKAFLHAKVGACGEDSLDFVAEGIDEKFEVF